MSLEATLEDITLRLRQGRFANEQAISQGIVLRLLQQLGWDTWDTTHVWPEFQTGEGRADFALCHPPRKPAALVEVKQPGLAEDAVRQALEYAFHTGVPFVVLTDGKTWGFYLPAEQGSYDDRRVYKLDLFERSSAEAAARLHDYLAYSAVASGKALDLARAEYRSRSRRSQARAAIPEAWRELVEKGNEELFDLLAAGVESKAGIRPDIEDITEFLCGLSRLAVVPKAPPRVAQATPSVSAPRPSPIRSGESTRTGILRVGGKELPYGTAKEAMVMALRELALTDPSFLERCSQHPEARGRKRRYIARTAEELYPDREDLREHQASLPGGWLVATNLNNSLKKNIIRLAAEVAGLKFGRDVVVDF